MLKHAASDAVARLAPMSGQLMPPARRALAPSVVGIVGAPGHCPAAASPHWILVGTAHRGSSDLVFANKFNVDALVGI